MNSCSHLLFKEKVSLLAAGDVVVAAKHVPDAILEARGIGLSEVTKRRAGEGKERARKTAGPKTILFC